MPAVYVGAPADRGEYKKVLVDDIEVYISKFIDLSQGLKIVTSGFAMFKGLAVVPLR